MARTHRELRTRTVLGLFKLRIGVVIMITALVGFAVTPGPGARHRAGDRAGAVGAGFGSGAGAFNQYVEDDIDRLMARTRGRAFVTGALPHSPAWLVLIGAAAGCRGGGRRGLR